MNSWRKKTRTQYNAYLKRYETFCQRHGSEPLTPTETITVDFLTDMYNSGYGYSAINTARAAVSGINSTGSHPLVCRYMRGVFNLRPSIPRYTHIWDVSIVLNYLRTLPAVELNLHMLSVKLVTPCALTAGQRCQTLHALDIAHMQLTQHKAMFPINTLLKTASPKSPTSVITLNTYREDRRLCVFTCLRHYLKRTKQICSSTKLFISTHSPHGGVTKDTLARWIKLILMKSGIDTKVFKPHSTRAAASSAAVRSTDISLVLQTAGWSSERTFAMFYNKPIQRGDASSQFAASVLSSKPFLI